MSSTEIDGPGRQPVHVVYGGAHLFRADICRKLGGLAQRAMAEYAPDPATFALALGVPRALAETVYERVGEKLRREPVEDYRVDFEDGYGIRPDEEEDAAVDAAAAETAAALDAGTLPPFFGIRIKPLNQEWRSRGIRTLKRFLDVLLSRTGGRVPPNFVVTLAKITQPRQVSELAEVLEPFSGVRIEAMIETPQSVLRIPELIESARGRLAAAHFGAYDYTALLGITAAHQSLLHPACDFARSLMQLHFTGTGIWLADGGTTVLPVAPHRGPSLSPPQQADNRAAVHHAWKLHYEGVSHSLVNGFYQGWDLHPAQLPARFAAVYAFFLDGLEAQSQRLRNFITQAAQATQSGGVFDDAATGQGLLNYFLRAINCGAIPEQDVPALAGMTMEELQSVRWRAL